jgi:phosphate transport system substrate-binding protein
LINYILEKIDIFPIEMRFILITLFLFTLIHNSYARKQVKIVGSSTVFPFVTAAAEEFGSRQKYKTPIVEATGTGGGIKIFCQGIGANFPDIANASRQIKQKEIEICQQNNITKITEIKIGYDGIIIANKIGGKNFNLSKHDLFLALAKKIPRNGKLISNPYNSWHEINPKLPKQKIYIYGPPPTSGTRDAFNELVMQEVCLNITEFKEAYPDKKERKQSCSIFRDDNKYAQAGENDNIVIQKLVNNQHALGIFGYSFLEDNSHLIQAAKIDNFKPEFKNITSGKYPISRSLFIYVKDKHYEFIESLKPFIKELTSEDAIGEYGYLTEKGLIPLAKKELEYYQKRI